MAANLDLLRPLLKKFEFTQLFNRLGWDHYQAQPLHVPVGQITYTLQGVAHKRGTVVLVCQPGSDGCIPDTPTRRRIDREAAKAHHEHLLVFVDGAKTTQVWQWVGRDAPGQPSRLRQHTFHKNQPGDALLQKLDTIRFKLAEEETLTQPQVPARVRQAFDIDRVTKRFYDKFKTEHSAFLKFIEGITEMGDREWYASVMLNRLMFVYFIQKQGFLGDDKNYLHNRLEMVRTKRGNDQFHSFYREFLLRLFHEGFAKPVPRGKDIDALLGKIPYLNGGIFDMHELEKNNPKLHIPDEAFERIFTFFESYDWYLEPRSPQYYAEHPDAKEEINPDVLGYILEKYINNKQMGAYYTKEDITHYIARNTILPYLFDAVAQKRPTAFQAGGPLWQLLSADPDRYIYEAVRVGVDVPLPKEIAAGLTDVQQRQNWNRAATADFALPTETWREHIARRQRCLELRQKLAAGEVHAVNDLITYNLDIQRFAEDVIDTCDDAAVLLAFWQTLQSVSILDPTCGSGAFLFAALNILQPLYEACLDRMRDLLDSDDQSGNQGLAEFRKVLGQVQGPLHPNRGYFVLKSILVNNLYGVDIMKEAVEICKLRLFLKLVAQVERVEHLEPLPDIDFNIRAGNTLIGFATLEDVQKTIAGTLAYEEVTEEVAAIVKDAEYVDKAFQMFHDVQTVMHMQGSGLAKPKQHLRQLLDHLNAKLHRYMAGEYGIDPDKPDQFAVWKSSHLPFHWFAEFHGIMKRGGFDVIIGNPPWKEYAAVKREDHYTVRDYQTERCGNLHIFCTERALRLRSAIGRMSYIVQLPLTCSSRMKTGRQLLRAKSSSLFVLSFDDRPGKLFDGLEHCRSVIFLSAAPRYDLTLSLATTRYHRWPTEAREYLFAGIVFAHINEEPIYPDHFPKSVSDLQESVFRKLQEQTGETIGRSTREGKTKHFIFYQEATGYWIKATIGLPYYAKNGVEAAPAHGRYLYFSDANSAQAACAVLNSSLFYAYFITHGDCFHLSDTLATGFPIKALVLRDPNLVQANSNLMRDLKERALQKTINTRDGDKITYAEFYASLSKTIIDEIDRILAKHYGFTDEELDFIINYDIKYRMGQDSEEED